MEKYLLQFYRNNLYKIMMAEGGVLVFSLIFLQTKVTNT